MVTVDKKIEKTDYSFRVVGIRNALKTLEEQLLKSETAPTAENYQQALGDIHTIWKHLELLELTVQRKAAE